MTPEPLPPYITWETLPDGSTRYTLPPAEDVREFLRAHPSPPAHTPEDRVEVTCKVFQGMGVLETEGVIPLSLDRGIMSHEVVVPLPGWPAWELVLQVRRARA